MAQSNGVQYFVSHLAGPFSAGIADADGTGTLANFGNPTSVAMDGVGNLYITDGASNTIRVMTPSGAVTTIAGTSGVSGSVDGTGSSALFSRPSGIAVDASGDIYVADTGNHTIRKISPAGLVTTLAGSAGVPGGDDGQGHAARFNSPMGLAVDSKGILYVADSGNETIREVDIAGNVTTIAGDDGTLGFVNTGMNSLGQTTAANFYTPTGVAVDSSGNIYVADSGNSTIRKIAPGGGVTNLAGDDRGGDVDGTGISALFYGAQGVSVDSTGNVYVADTLNFTIREVTPTGVVTTLAGTKGMSGSADGTGANASFSYPTSLVVGLDGNIYVADSGNNLIRKVTANGGVSTVAGLQGKGFQDGMASVARFDWPTGVALDGLGNVYVADNQNGAVRIVSPEGVVSTLEATWGPGFFGGMLGSARSFPEIEHLAFDNQGNLYLTQAGGIVAKISPEGVATYLAGASGQYTFQDFKDTFGVAVDSQGNVYTSDYQDFVISKITPSGVVSPIAGSSGQMGYQDGTGIAARFSYPEGLAVDSADNVYVADTGNGRIRMITPAGVVSTVNTGPGFSSPAGLAIDGADNLYFTDNANDVIKMISPAGAVTTIAGSYMERGDSDGIGASARFASASQIAVDRAGNFYVADVLNEAIRKGTVMTSSPSASIPPQILVSPSSLAIDTGNQGFLWVSAFGGPPLSYQWFLNGAPIAGATGALIQASSAGSYTVRVTNNAGTATSEPATLAVNSEINGGSLGFSEQPESFTVASGSTVVLDVSASVVTPPTGSIISESGPISYQWFLNGAPIAGATDPTYIINGATSAEAGNYTCIASDSLGAMESNVGTLGTVTTSDPGRLTNISCRAEAGTGGNVIIAGFVVGGAGTSGDEQVLVRASGPVLGLSPFNLAGVLPDPELTLTNITNGASEVVTTDSGWGGSAAIAAASAQEGAFSWGAKATADSAVYESLQPGNYTAEISGTSGDTGTALVEVYDATPAGTYGVGSSRLTNLSTRVNVGTGANIVFAGFVIGGTTAKTVLIRASGPALSHQPFNLSGTLPDPQLTLTNVGVVPSKVIATNKGWNDDPGIAAIASSVGAFGWAPGADSAILITLPPGNYTAGVAGASGDTGIALIEIYEVP